MFPPIDNTLRWKSRDVRVGYELDTQLVAVVDAPFDTEADAIDAVLIALGRSPMRPAPPPAPVPTRREPRSMWPFGGADVFGGRSKRGRKPVTRDAVVECLRGAPAGMNVVDVAVALGKTKAAVRGVIYRLAADGEAISERRGVYRLADVEAQP